MMKHYSQPQQKDWEELVRRPELASEDLTLAVAEIIEAVKKSGDKALIEFANRFDHVALDEITVKQSEIEVAQRLLPQKLKEAIALAAQNIRLFHEEQRTKERVVETMEGVRCWRKAVPIRKVGLYIPGGSAPLFSTILMLAIPAKIAGCERIALCTPCDQDGNISPAILFTASFLGITEIYKVGGAQAIAAMAFGTATIPKVDKIFGPGNQFVTKAKTLVQAAGVAIDLPAGPSEVLVIADAQADPEFIAADLLSQAEHGVDSQVVLVSNSNSLIREVQNALQDQLAELSRASLARETLANSFTVYFHSLEECIEFSNAYAPEHLILALDKAVDYADKIQNAGSVFLGKYACESIGDYASGTNHTLPTNGYARGYSGVSYDSFVKKITFQEVTKEGLKNIGDTVEIMAEAEQLLAHKNAVSIRLKKIENGE